MVSPFFVKCTNRVFRRWCYTRYEAWGLSLGSVEAFMLIVSSTMALFWLAVRSESKRSLSTEGSEGSVADANPGSGDPAFP